MNMGTWSPHSRGVPKIYDTGMAFPEALVSTWDQVRISGKKALDHGNTDSVKPVLAM